MAGKDFSRNPNFGLIREYKARMVGPELLRRFNAHAVGIAQKRSGGEPTGDLALVFYVTAKQPEDTLSERETVPSVIQYRSQKDKRPRRILTDVVESPRATFEVDPETRIRPVPGGVSGGTNASTGTIGGWVWDNTDDSIVMLSNDHVFGHAAGTDILQQGTVDGGSLPGDKIGDVKRGIARTTRGTNTVDCSIGDPDSSDIYDLTVLEVGPAVYATETAVLDMEVEKFGQTTQHTFGRIIDADYSTLVDDTWFFDDCLRIEPISPSNDWSAGGDSGSIVFRQEPTSEGGTLKPAVGLHFAGGGIYGVACKIGNVFSALDLDNLCSGAFSSFLDNQFGRESESDDEVAGEGLRPDVGRPVIFTNKERRRASSRNTFRGISRDVQGALRNARQGRQLTDLVDTHRGELLTMLTKNGDIRRATVAALRPLTSKALTTRDLFSRVIAEDDVARFEKLADEVERNASDDLRNAMAPLRKLTKSAPGTTLGKLFGVKE